MFSKLINKYKNLIYRTFKKKKIFFLISNQHFLIGENISSSDDSIKISNATLLSNKLLLGSGKVAFKG